MSRPGVGCGAAVLVAVAFLAACSCGVDRNAESKDRPAEPNASELCHRLEVPLGVLAEDGLTVEDALTEPGKAGVGIRAGFAFVRAQDADDAERFQPVLRYLVKRWTAESIDRVARPDPPSDAVVQNARELDRFLADGGCG